MCDKKPQGAVGRKQADPARSSSDHRPEKYRKTTA